MDIKKSISYFRSLIDEQGIVQFTKGYEKDYAYGYAIEDQSRALVLALELGDKELAEKFFKLISRSITDKGVLMLWDKTGKFKDKIDSEGEAVAEAVWGLGCVGANEETNKLWKYILTSPHPRTWPYGILGAVELGNTEIVTELGFKIVAAFRNNASADWKWLEKRMTYGNALFPWSLIKAYDMTKIVVFKEVADELINFLLINLIYDGKPIMVGFDGWWKKGEKMVMFGQQPIDVAYMVLALLDYYKITGEEKYLEKAKFYFSWYDGNNILNLPMIREDGACMDGLWQNGVNPNAGAESNICYLLAAVKIQNQL